MSEFIQCDLVGSPVYSDLDGECFYAEALVNNVSVRIGDCVRTALESEEDGYCQILAIYDDTKGGEGVFVEARWFKFPNELTDKKRRA